MESRDPLDRLYSYTNSVRFEVPYRIPYMAYRPPVVVQSGHGIAAWSDGLCDFPAASSCNILSVIRSTVDSTRQMPTIWGVVEWMMMALYDGGYNRLLPP